MSATVQLERDQIVSRLLRLEPELRALGVTRMAMFGSRSRAITARTGTWICLSMWKKTGNSRSSILSGCRTLSAIQLACLPTSL